MRVLFFDCFSGISGDMTLGALIDLGIDKDVFRSELDKLNLAGYELIIEKKVKNGITGTDVHVILNEEYEDHQKKLKEHEHVHESSHHAHPHPHGHEHHGRGHSHNARNLPDIEHLIDASDIDQKAKDFSKKVFREIARAEAKVHNKEINEVHFHEVGAIDSIVDIVGAAICLQLLGVERIFSSPLHDGKGFINCQHGVLPVPVPAVMEMLKDSNIPLVPIDVNTELVTPTGIGIIKCLTSDFGRMPAMIVERIGYGMGKRETGRFNALRVVLGTLFEEDRKEEIAVLETNIDDMSPELMGYTMEALLENGALDAFYTPIFMKKNRPSAMLTVLSELKKEEGLVDIIMKETSTLGIRRSVVSRYCMDRDFISVDTGIGQVRVKHASRGEIEKLAPEYEDCREIAKKTGLPIREVYDIAMEKARGMK